MAQEYEYVPFVREGVKWVYCISNDDSFHGPDPCVPIGLTYLTLEFKGDTIINGKTYKAMHKYSGKSINQENDTIPVYMREENKVVYGIVPDCKFYHDCRIGLWDNPDFYDLKLSGEEFVLYDFNDPVSFLDTELNWDEECDFGFAWLYTDTIAIGNHYSKRHKFQYETDFYLVEGIGYDGWSSYTLMLWFTTYLAAPVRSYQDADFYLNHVIEDEEIIYKGIRYQEPNPEPDEYEYVPFVREGVQWVYSLENPFTEETLGIPEGMQYYSFEMLSDVLIGDKYYKPVLLTHYLDKNGTVKEVEDFIPAYLREENKVVYAIRPDGIWHPQCPVGYFSFVSDGNIAISSEEFILYDFEDPMSFYSKSEWAPDYATYDGNSLISIGTHQSKCHHYKTWYAEDEKIIEGIGYDGIAGMPLFYFEMFISGLQVGFGLSHVIEGGEIIYKGLRYDPDIHVGIDEVVPDRTQRPQDPRYYDLMGRAVGTDVPTTPGIYIHQGKKIVVR